MFGKIKSKIPETLSRIRVSSTIEVHCTPQIIGRSQQPPVLYICIYVIETVIHDRCCHMYYCAIMCRRILEVQVLQLQVGQNETLPTDTLN